MILIADDQAPDLIAMLVGHGYQVRTATEDQPLLETARRLAPDLILLAAGAGAYAACQGLKADEETCDIPVLFVEPPDRARVFAVGGADYVTEPLLEQEVLARVEAHVGLRAVQRRLEETHAELEQEISKRAELGSTLQEAEAQGHDLVESLSDVIYAASRDGTVTYISPAIESFSGYSPAEVTGRHFKEFIYEEDLVRLGGNLQRLLVSGLTTDNEYRVVTKSGDVRWMRTSSQPTFEGGRIVGVQGVLSDITERKVAEQEMRQQSEFLSSVLESLTHPFYVIDAVDFTIQIANRAARVGGPSGSATCYALTHARSRPCDTAEHPCPVAEIKRTGKPVTVEHIHYDRQGNARNVEVHGYPLFDDQGNVARVIEYSFDITERKQAEAALQASEEKWRSLTEYSPDHIMSLDRDATILFINHTLPGLSREQVIGTSFYDYALPDYRQTTQDCFARVLETGQPDRFESVYSDDDGNSVAFESYVGPVWRDGAVCGLTVRSTDITEVKRAQDALQELTHSLGERVKELNCLYGVSKLAGRPGISLEETLRGTVELIIPAFRYPELACARIIHEDQEFRTHNFRETQWVLATDLVVHGERAGTLEVYYLEERPQRAEGPFLEEERHLVEAVAERLGRIVEHMRAEEALRQSEKRYRQLLEALQEGIWVIDQDAFTTFVNPRMAEMLGYTVEEMQGEHLFDFMDERGVEITTRNLERREQGIKEQHDFEFLRKDGSRMYAMLETSPIYDDEGNYVGGIAGIQDITERRQAERKLREAMAAAEKARREEMERRQEAERRRQIADGLAEVLAALNSNQDLDQVLDLVAVQTMQLLDNQAVAVYRLQGESGVPAVQAAQGLPSDCVDGLEQLPGQAALQQAVSSGQPVAIPDLAAASSREGGLALGLDAAVRGAPHARRFRGLLVAPIDLKDEVYGGLALYYAEPRAFCDDDMELVMVFSDQVALAVENARFREQVEQAAAAAERGRLARDLHDSVTQALFSASLVAEVLPQVWRRDPEEGMQGLEELRHLTRGALSEMRTMLLELRPSALVETRLEDLLRQLAEAITGRTKLSVELHLQPIPDLPPKVHVTFYRVAQEALHNVVKHAEASRVTISLRASPPVPPQRVALWRGQVILQVSDDGPGFDPGEVGPGQLGLSIMRERAETVGAVLGIEGRPGGGTQVSLIWQER
jgi:PAS domain S-box-containing protein